MKGIKFFLLSAALVSGLIEAQNQGCTDSQATNYDPTATENDGSCTYPSTTINPTNSNLLDVSISETSGLIYWDGKIWTHNDNSDSNLYALDPSNGAILNTISLSPAVNTDWEDIAQDENYIYVGDFGNNASGNRTNLKILKVSKASIVAEAPEIQTINFSYADQTNFEAQEANNTDYDCEAMIVTADSIYLFSKQWKSAGTSLYKLPKVSGTYEAQIMSSYNVNGLITGAAYFGEEDVVVLSGYSTSLAPFVYLLYDYQENEFLSGNKRKLNLNLPFHQVEGITTMNGRDYYISNERLSGGGVTINQRLHLLDLEPYLENHLTVINLNASSAFTIFPNPVTETLELKMKAAFNVVPYILYDNSGKEILRGEFSLANKTLDVSKISSGIYLLKIGDEKSDVFRVVKN